MPPMEYQTPASKLNSFISSAVIHMPDDADWSTGTFTTTFRPKTFKRHEGVGSSIFNPPRFQISVTINPNRDVAIALGKADGSDPSDRQIFRMPFLNLEVEHTFKVEFVRWTIFMVHLDGSPLHQRGGPAPV